MGTLLLFAVTLSMLAIVALAWIDRRRR